MMLSITAWNLVKHLQSQRGSKGLLDGELSMVAPPCAPSSEYWWSLNLWSPPKPTQGQHCSQCSRPQRRSAPRQSSTPHMGRFFHQILSDDYHHLNFHGDNDDVHLVGLNEVPCADHVDLDHLLHSRHPVLLHPLDGVLCLDMVMVNYDLVIISDNLKARDAFSASKPNRLGGGLWNIFHAFPCCNYSFSMGSILIQFQS